MTERKKVDPTPAVNPIFATVFGSEEVVILNSLFQAGMRPAKEPREKTCMPDPRRN